MPEIKHNFTGGKMNKDVDERLVPNGEYRDAMNIQVSTSEGSEVGTIQNILGNIKIDGFIIPELNEHCIASVADEKNDAGYYFIAGGAKFDWPSVGVIDAAFWGTYPNHTPALLNFERDMIVKFDGTSTTPVFVDPYLKTAVCSLDQHVGNQIMIHAGSNPFAIEAGDIITRIETQNGIYDNLNIPILLAVYFGPNAGKLLISEDDVVNLTLKLEILASAMNAASQFRIVIDRRDSRVLKFDVIEGGLRSTRKLITGINIIDDLLLWTDGYTEPKKINIDRSIQGTTDSLKRTKLIVNKSTSTSWDDSISNWGLDTIPQACEEEHITVIKKTPNIAPTISALTSFRQGFIDAGFTATAQFYDAAASGPVPLSSVVIIIIDDDPDSGAFNAEVGDILRFSSNPSEPPPQYFEIRASVLSVSHDPFTLKTTISVEIDSMSSDGIVAASSNTAVDWEVALEELGKSLFEQKLPRFSTRYKYEDNEYSAPGPFSEVVFIPGDFRYHPTEAYNTGMVNTLRELTLQDFISSDIPKDVVQVDLLYKNETSPNIYIIESITKDDTLVDGQNAWTSQGSQDGLFGSYKVSSENIYSTLPSNQLLRSWDNVPRAALAQEVSGNRTVYANYLQNYNLINEFSKQIVPNIKTTIGNRGNRGDNKGLKSIKSLRSYDIGVIWGDKYNRETPIITPSSGSTLVPKTRASLSNSLNIELDGNHPYWADYYKVFVKETSNEYYNLAMDRMYDAKDGNVWLSFPSIDRNKVDEDTYLILKKRSDTEEAVTEKARYKIVAIENEAPDYIKTSYELLAETNDDASKRIHSGNIYGGGSGPTGLPDGLGRNAPTPGQKGFSIAFNMWTLPWGIASATTGMGLPDLVEMFNKIKQSNDKDLLVSFSRNDVPANKFGVTKKYGVVSIDVNDPSTPTFYSIDIDEPILVLDEFITTNMESGNDYVSVHFWEKKIQNKPEFDGRFFVKIMRDDIVDDNLLNDNVVITNWMVSAATAIYYIKDTSHNHNDGQYSLSNPLSQFPPSYASAGTAPAPTSPNSNTRTKADWQLRLKFGGTTIKSAWFIDNASFAGEQDQQENSYEHAETKWNLGSSKHVESADTTSGISNYQYIYTHLGIDVGVSNLFGTENMGTGMSTGVIGMRGPHTILGSPDAHYLDLSYSKIDPGLNSYQMTTNKDVNFTVGDDANQFPVGIATNSNTDDPETIAVVKSLKPNQRFRIAGNADIYKIISVTKHKLYNYRGKHVAPYRHGHSIGFIDMWAYNQSYLPQHEEISESTNRRSTYRIKYEIDLQSTSIPGTNPGNWDILPNNSSFLGVYNHPNTKKNATIEFIDQFTDDGENKISLNPAIFETEPKEDADLDIYYEATNKIPTKLTIENQELFIPIGAVLEVDPSIASIVPEGIFVTGWEDPSINAPSTLILSQMLTTTQFGAIVGMPEIKFVRDDGSFTSVTSQGGPIVVVNGVNMIYALTVEISNKIGLGWFNCWSFNNGVESNRIGDTYNKPFITNGVKVSSVIIGNYEEEKRINGLIYSGIYNSNSNVNELNQFIAAEKITKDLNPTYGSIQKLYSQSSAEGDLIALCEDRILKILANKDALYNADGNSQLVSTNNVLGRAIPFSGEYGISKNPESFASEAYRAYFTDKVRGTVMRLSKDGLTPISNHGMKDWFRDNLKLSNKLIGSHDDKKDEYNLTLKEMGTATFGTVQSTILTGEANAEFEGYSPQNATANIFVPIGTQVSIGDTVSGPGFSPAMNFVVTDITPGSYMVGSATFYYITVEVNNGDPTGIYGATGNWSNLPAGMTDNGYNSGSQLTGLALGYTSDVQFGTTISTPSQDPTYSFPSKTLTFKEDVKGWVSFKSFFPENAISVANEYYTLVDGELWKHHEEGDITAPHPRNTFYGNHTASSFNVILNDLPGSVKSFQTINYEGSQSKVDKLLTYTVTIGFDIVTQQPITATFNDNEYHNLTNVNGWYVDNIQTDKQKGGVNEFIEKEGKWFNYIKGDPIIANSTGEIVNDIGGGEIISGFDAANFNTQGLGMARAVNSPITFGCTDPTMANFNPAANAMCDAHSTTTGPGNNECCVTWVLGCMDFNANNHDPNATQQPSAPLTCHYYGCMDDGLQNNTYWNAIFTVGPNVPQSYQGMFGSGYPGVIAVNYDPSANVEDGTCIQTVLGCTDNSQTTTDTFTYNTSINYNAAANTDDGSCIPTVLGCMDNTTQNTNGTTGALNYDIAHNLEVPLQFSGQTTIGPLICAYPLGGCMDSVACNFDPLATTDDGSCAFCGDDGNQNGSTFPGQQADNYSPLVTCLDAPTCLFCLQSNLVATNVGSQEVQLTWDESGYNATTSLYYDYGALALSYTITWGIVGGGTTAITVNSSTPTISWNTGSISFTIGASGSNTNPLLGNEDYEFTIKPNCDSTFGPDSTITASTPHVNGCTDPTAVNYDAAATFDDGSCCTVIGCTTPSACNYDPSVPPQCGNGSLCVGTNGCMDDGCCTTGIAPDPLVGATCAGFSGAYHLCPDYNTGISYNSPYPGYTYCPWDQAVWVSITCQNSDITCCYGDSTANPQGGLPDADYCGCTDPAAANYDVNATCPDLSLCIANTYGCTDPTATNYNNGAFGDDGSCCWDPQGAYTGDCGVEVFPGDPNSSGSTTNGGFPDINGHGSGAIYDCYVDQSTPTTPSLCHDAFGNAVTAPWEGCTHDANGNLQNGYLYNNFDPCGCPGSTMGTYPNCTP